MTPRFIVFLFLTGITIKRQYVFGTKGTVWSQNDSRRRMNFDQRLKTIVNKL